MIFSLVTRPKTFTCLVSNNRVRLSFLDVNESWLKLFAIEMEENRNVTMENRKKLALLGINTLFTY